MGKSKDLATGASTLYQTQTTSDTRYVNTAGDTMTGALTLNNDIIANKYLRLYTTDDQANQWYVYNNTDDTLRFNYNGAGNDEVVLDTVGRMSVPNQPHFFARGYSANVSGTDRATFSSIVRNNGSHFNNSTGNFTCPVAGTYHVTAFSGYKAADGYLGMGVGYNGSVLQYGWSSTNTNHAHATQCCTVVFYASANDTFYYYVNPASYYVKPNSSTGYSGMSVYLLG